MKKVKVEFKNIVKKFNETTAVDNISCDFEPGTLTTLLGPSGCGKTTSLRLIAGLERATSGNILIDNEDITIKPATDRDVSMVFQSYALFPHMTVLENVSYGLKMINTEKKEYIEKSINTLNLVGLENFEKRMPSELSGGQQQRVAVARAIVLEPKVLLFDEPLSNLDAKLRIDMRTEIKRLHQRLGSTIIYVTHDQVEAMTLATKIAVLKDGCIQQFDTPYEIYNNPSNMFVANFMGAPAMNLIEGIVVMKNKDIEFEMKNNKGDVISLPIDGVKGLENYISKTVIFGIRPESINDLELSGKKSNKKLVEKAVEIDVVEPAGSDTYAIVEFGGKQVVTRLNGNSVVAAGEKVKLTFNLSQAVFFDIDTEERIR